MERGEFLGTWKSLPDSSEVSRNIQKVRTNNTDAIKSFLGQNNIFTIACRNLEGKV